MTSDEFTEQLDENLRKWFKEKWVRFGPDGKIRGACARGDDSEGKPKCLPQKKAQNLGKKGRKYAASKKRREDPNPERRGPAKNVATKKKSNEDIQVNEKWSQKYKDSINCSNPKGFSQKAHCAGKKKNEDMNENIPFNECPKCRGPIVHESMMNEKQDACYHKVKSRYKVWPSAYASGALVQCRKKGASNWGTGGKKNNESSIMKGIVAESENVLVLYIDGKPSTKYTRDHEAKGDLEKLRAKYPNRKFELKRETRGGIGGNKKMDEAGSPAQQAAIAINMKKRGEKPKNEGVIIGHDKDDPQVAVLGGAGSYSLSNLKKKAMGEAKQLAQDVANGEYKNSAYNVKQLANTLNTIVAAEEEMEKLYFGEDYTGEFAAEVTPAINPYGGLKDNKFRGAIGEALLSEMPTDNPTGASGEGGWRKYKPKPAGEIDEAKKSELRLKAEHQQLKQLEKINNSTLPHWAKEYLTLLTDPKGKVFKAAYYSFGKGQDARKEAAEYIMQKYKIPQEWIDKINFLKGSHVTKNREEDRHFNWDMPSMHEDTAYAGGMGQGGNAGESYRKFKPKSAGTFKEDELDEACWKGYHKEGNKKMFGKTYPNCVKNTNEEELEEGWKMGALGALTGSLLGHIGLPADAAGMAQLAGMIAGGYFGKDINSLADLKDRFTKNPAEFKKLMSQRKEITKAKKIEKGIAVLNKTVSDLDEAINLIKNKQYKQAEVVFDEIFGAGLIGYTTGDWRGLEGDLYTISGVEEFLGNEPAFKYLDKIHNAFSKRPTDYAEEFTTALLKVKQYILTRIQEVENTNKEQLDEKCWDTHKQVGMKNKGGKQVPNCVPKESAIMKGLKR